MKFKYTYFFYKDSYVRKTAAICIAKLYDDTPELME